MNCYYTLTPNRQTTSHALSGGAMSWSYTMTKDANLEWVGIKFGATVTETVTVTFDSLDGANYDLVIDTTDLSSESNYFYKPTTPFAFQKGDILKVTVTAATATTTAYLTAFIRDYKSFVS